MKVFSFFVQFLLVLSTVLYCDALKLPKLKIKNPLKYYINEFKDDLRDKENYNNCENIERNIYYNGERQLDVYYDKENTSELKPVYIFLYGGAWHSGNKVKFTKFGSLFETNGYVAVLPNYVLFPCGGFEDMVDDVYHAFKWTFENIRKFGGDPENVNVAAYSAGSHLTTLTLLKSLFGYPNKNQFLEPLPHFKKLVLLNGPYDFDDYSQTIKLIARPDNSIVEKLARHIFRTQNVSPTDLLKEQPDNSVNNVGADRFIFFYTSKDTEVRESSAINFMAQLKRVCPSADIKYVYKEGYEHTTVTRGVRGGKKEQEDVFMSLIRD